MKGMMRIVVGVNKIKTLIKFRVFSYYVEEKMGKCLLSTLKVYSRAFGRGAYCTRGHCRNISS